MLSFIMARGGGTSLWSSTLMAPVGILFKHCESLSNEKSKIENTDLSDNAQTLPEFLDSTQVAVVTVPVLTHGHIKLDLPVDDQQRRRQQLFHPAPRRTCRTARPCAGPTSRRFHAA